MVLHQPFKISARLCPGLRLGGAWLSLLNVEASYENRDLASFALDFAEGPSFYDRNLRSGAGGFRNQVEPFESFLSFLLAAVESLEYEQRNPGRRGDNTALFPLWVVEWALDNKSDIESVQCDLRDDDGRVLGGLIEETA